MTMILVGDQIVNLDNLVSFDIDGGVVVRLWYVGSSSPVSLQPPVPAQRVVETLRAKGLL